MGYVEKNLVSSETISYGTVIVRGAGGTFETLFCTSRARVTITKFQRRSRSSSHWMM